MRVIKIIVALILCAGITDAGQIVSTEKVQTDSTKEIKIVSPDEIQRLENERDRDIELLKREVQELQLRVKKLESQINK